MPVDDNASHELKEQKKKKSISNRRDPTGSIKNH